MRQLASAILAMMLFFLACENRVAQELTYSIEEFRIDYYFPQKGSDGGMYFGNIPKAYGVEVHQKGLTYEQAMEKFPGAHNFFYPNSTVLEGITTPKHKEPFMGVMPIVSCWRMKDNEWFVVVWERNAFGKTQTQNWFILDDIPDWEEYKLSVERAKSFGDVYGINTIMFDTQRYGIGSVTFEVFMRLGWAHFLWKENGELSVHTMVYNVETGQIGKEFKDEAITNELSDFLFALNEWIRMELQTAI